VLRTRFDQKVVLAFVARAISDVGHLRIACFSQEDVLGLYVSVDYLALMYGSQILSYLRAYTAAVFGSSGP
jgi:hypothetical protein